MNVDERLKVIKKEMKRRDTIKKLIKLLVNEKCNGEKTRQLLSDKFKTADPSPTDEELAILEKALNFIENRTVYLMNELTKLMEVIP